MYNDLEIKTLLQNLTTEVRTIKGTINRMFDLIDTVPLQPYFTKKEAAQLLGVTAPKLYAITRQRHNPLQVTVLAKREVIARKEIIRYLSVAHSSP